MRYSVREYLKGFWKAGRKRRDLQDSGGDYWRKVRGWIRGGKLDLLILFLKEIDVLGGGRGAFDYTDVQGGLGEGADKVLLSAYFVWSKTADLQALWLCHQDSADGTHNLWEANIEVFHSWSLYRPLTKGSEISPPSLEKVKL